MKSSDEEKLNNSGIGSWFVKSRNIVLLIFMALIIPSSFFASKIKTDNAIERWLGTDDPHVNQWDQFRERYNISNQITAIFNNILPNDPRIEKVAKLMESQSIIDNVWTPERFKLMMKGSLPSIPAHHQNKVSGIDPQAGALTPGNSVSFEKSPLAKILIPDGNSTAIWIELNQTASVNSRQTVRILRSCVLNSKIPSEDFHYGGPLVVNAALDYWGEKSISLLLPFIGAICFYFLWMMGNSFSSSLLLLFSSTLTILFTFALMSVCGVQLNLLLIVLPALIGVLHLSTGIHIVYHYNSWKARLESSEKQADNSADRNSQSLTKTFSETFKPAILATFTTVIGMLSLMISDLEPVRLFGIWSSVGLTISFVVAYTFIPCFLLNSIEKPNSVFLSTNWLSPVFFWKRRMVFLTSAALLFVTMPGWSALKSDLNALHFIPTYSTTIQNYNYIESKSCGLIPVEIDIDLSKNSNPLEKYKELYSISQQIQEHPDITHALSVATFYDPTTFATTEAKVNKTQGLRENWCSENGTHYRISALVKSDSKQTLESISNDIQKRLEGKQVILTGLVSLIDRSQSAIFESLRDSLFLAGILVGGILIFILKSIPAGLIAMIPNIAPIIIGFGLSGWMNIQVGIGMVLTGSIALGIALDDTLHFLHQFKQASKKTRSIGKIVRNTWQSCSWPMIQTSFVASAGLLVLSVSNFRPVARFGQLMALLLLLALIADLVFLPFLLTTRASKFFVKESS